MARRNTVHTPKGSSLTNQYLNLIEHAADGIAIIQDGLIKLVNSALVQMFGYDREDILGMPFFQVLTPEYQALVKARYQDRLNGQEVPHIYTVKAVNKKGEVRDIEINAALTEFEGRPADEVIVRDITERKQTETRVRLRLELEETITGISSRFVGVTDIDDAIRAALADVSRLSGANRAVLSLYNKDNPSLASIYEWLRDENGQQVNIYRNNPVPRWPWWEATLDRGKVIHAKDIAALPAEASVEKEAYLKRGCHSVLALPLSIAGHPAGFLAFNNVTQTEDWGPDELSVIKMVADIIGTAFERQRAAVLYRTLANSAPMGIYIVQKGKFVFVNPEFQRITGYTEAELLGTESLQLVHPEDRELVATNAVAMLKGTRPNPYEFRVIRKDGDTIWTTETAASIQYDGRRATLGFFTDTTEQRKTVQALRESEEELRSMFESISDGLVIVDLDGIIIDLNQKVLEIHGFKSRNEMMGKYTWKFVTPEAAANWPNEKRLILERGSLEPHEISIIKKDGSELTCEISASACWDAAGNPTSIVFTIRDITERKRIEAVLALETALLEAAAETTIDGILAVDNNFRLIMTNKRFQEIFNIPQALIDAGDFPPVREHILSQVKDPDGYTQNIEELMNNPTLKQSYEFETKESRAIDQYSSPLTDKKGQHYGRITYFRDVTDRKNALLREQELKEEVNRASRLASIGEMAAGVAHEINNPLTSVIGFAQLLLGRDVPDDIRDELTVIDNEAQRVARIVEGMLTFARGSLNGDELVDINQTISEVLEMRSYQMTVSNIQYTARLAENLPPVKGNGNQLKQVFINIILNAEKAMSKAHGQGNLAVETERDGNTIRVSITDDGPGITPENLEKIFNPFFTTSDVGGGTGLGLSICHGIVTSHQGKIYARSQVGKGATLVVELPIPAASETDINKNNSNGGENNHNLVTNETPEPPHKARVLVVDDEPLISDLLQRILSQQGLDVVTANTAGNAVERLYSASLDLILMDIKMPLMNGMELYQYIRKVNPKMARRVIFITGDILEPSTSAFFKKYKLPHIAKPINMEHLYTAINNILPDIKTIECEHART